MQADDASRLEPLAPRRPLSRRTFLGASAALTASAAASPACGAVTPPIAFFLLADTHYLAEQESPQDLNEASRHVTTRLIETLNSLPGTNIPEKAGGGSVAVPQGVIHAGDIIDSGDKTGHHFEQMQETEWAAFCHDFGIRGEKSRLNYPTFEVHGNHDGPQGKGVAIDGIVARNKQRAGLTSVSENGLHYSWNWGDVHFLNLGIVVGQVPEVKKRRRYDPMQSLDFLIRDLREQVGESGRPVVITHHIDLARYTLPCDADDPKNVSREWHPCDVKGFYQAIQPYQVIAILHGHTHARNVLHWNGNSTNTDRGFSVFNVDNSSHFRGGPQAFFYCEIHPTELVMRECATKDRWESFFWTPQVWKRPIRIN